MREVKLAPYEIELARFVARERHEESTGRGAQNMHGARQEDSLKVHLQGAYGEIAAAKALGRYWPGSVNAGKAPDIPPGIQVRWTGSQTPFLIVRPGDADEHIFVLVSGAPPKLIVHGWIMGRDAKRDRWWGTHNDRPPTWWVPTAALRDIGELRAHEVPVRWEHEGAELAI